MRFFNVYQYLAPAVLFPLAYWLWWRRCDGSHRCTLLLLSMPFLYAYVIPGLGTNWLKLWEINTRLRLGKFRPHHGFVFGSATSLIALLCAEPRPADFGAWDVLRSGFVMGSVLAFWNWLYDIYAIKARFITIYNRAHAQNRGAEAIATDYAPALFGAFGFCYGVAVRVVPYCLLEQGDWQLCGWLFVTCNLAVLVVPVVVFVGFSYLRTGDTGLEPVKGG